MTNESVDIGRFVLTLIRNGNNITNVKIELKDGTSSINMYALEMFEVSRWLNAWAAKEHRSKRDDNGPEPKRIA